MCRASGISRPTLDNLIREPDSPRPQANGLWCVDDWREYLEKRGTVPTKGFVELSNEKLELQNKKLQFQIKVLQKEYSSNEDIEKWGAELGGEIRKIVTSLHLNAASLAGLPVAEIEIRLKEIEGEILGRLHLLGNRVESMKEEKEAAS